VTAANRTAARLRTSDSELEFPWAERLPAAGSLLPVADGVHWVRMPLPLALDHISLWVLDDDDGVTLVDCGFSSDATRECWDALHAGPLAGRPVRRLIVTHFHPDHLGLAWWLGERWGVQPWMAAAEWEWAQRVWHRVPGHNRADALELFRRHGSGEDFLAEGGKRYDLYRRGVAALPAGYRPIADGEPIGIGGREWRVIVGHGHSPEHCALHCASLGVLISGDMVLPRITTNVSVWPNDPEADPLGRFLASLARYRELPADTLVLPSHGRVFRGLRARIDQLADHHAERLDELEHALGTPCTAAQLLPVLFRRALDTEATAFAMGEAIAHLNHLWALGRAHRIEATDGRLRFRRA
jgi:glyoxylase-like metal-dependent hydrolase (beta-lactamase superfamily II)